MRLDEVQRLVWAPLLLQDAGAAEEERAEQDADPHRVVERHHAERSLAGPPRERGEVEERRRHLGSMRACDSLRLPGRTRGEEDQAEILGPWPAGSAGRPRDRRLRRGGDTQPPIAAVLDAHTLGGPEPDAGAE